ncbi:flavodoxin [Actinoplanes sp. SE50]|uniref:flavodoxin family protein n=1 Tax=unclassified Actinoplanes TaxID=2626549 RepID=UPI00023EDFE1|nr:MULTISPECIES: NAD(P)H-dependent oxidoreductase [unclassified Actinoplanes]AEV88362.1 Putative NAD(P)H-dependent FMN-containing oxidoreductase ywqN [Actinoplanes sp. SE50/110]ATO86767.1 flavodoxin [Actinoplanes sp. SE50]SLM04185.1 flavodoxin [Actinoplanes sp. SE50/110]
MTTRAFLFLLASARPDGNTELLARHAAAELPPGATQRWIRLADTPLDTYADIRHREPPQERIPTGAERLLLDATLEATDIVIASPLYWYSLSAAAKLYLDYWSGWLRVGAPGSFRARMTEKTLWGISVYSGDNPADADPLLGALQKSAEYFPMRWGGLLLGQGNRPADILQDTPTLTRAKTFFS